MRNTHSYPSQSHLAILHCIAAYPAPAHLTPPVDFGASRCSWGGACLALAWRDPTLTSMADAGAFGEGAGESDYAESTDKLEGFLNSFEDEDIHGQVGRSVRLGSGSEPGQGRGRAWGSGSQWCARAWPHHTRCTR